jgi:hypothetical protein
MFAAGVDESEKDAKLRPRAVAKIECVRVKLGIGAKPLEEPVNAIAAAVEFGRGKKIAVLGKEHEDETHEHREQRAVKIIGPLGENAREELVAALRVGVLEAAEQLI